MGEGNTPLQFAVKWGSPEAVCTLIALEADPTNKTDDGLSLMALATMQGHTSVVEALLQDMLPPLPDVVDDPPAFFKARDKNDKRWQLFRQAHRKNLELRDGAMPSVPVNFMLTEADRLGRCPLILSVVHHTEHLLPLLLGKQARVDDFDDRGNTALMWAAAGGDR